MNHKSGRSAFTLLEVIFVIVILGIVASLGSELIVKVYQQYIVQRAQHRASIKTELAATQIANRLASAIPGTVYRKRRVSGTEDWIEEITDDLGNPTQADEYNVLQWVGSDVEGFNTYDGAKVGWSGFCDIDLSDTDTIVTPGSDLSLLTNLRTYLGNPNTAPSVFAVYFPYDNKPYYGKQDTSTNTISLDDNTSHIVEHYKLARTSYALVTETNATTGEINLYLYYNFVPTPKTPIPANGPKSLLMKNISTFKFKGAGRTIRFKICKEEQIGEEHNVTACKEKAVF